jgi:hypothetical protein
MCLNPKKTNVENLPEKKSFSKSTIKMFHKAGATLSVIKLRRIKKYLVIVLTSRSFKSLLKWEMFSL